MNNFSLGQKIKFYRQRAGISQLELEILIGDSPGTVSRIENSKINPTKETLHDIANALNLTSEEKASLFDISLVELNSEYINLIVEQVISRLKQQ